MTDTEYMQIALDEAQKAYDEGEIPIGAVLVYKDREKFLSHRFHR